jgi:hypothetical protein
MRMDLIRLGDFPQYPLVRLVKRFGQLFEDAPQARGKTAPNGVNLARRPPKPIPTNKVAL